MKDQPKSFINEDAYLSEEEERVVSTIALNHISSNNLSFDEEEKYLKDFPYLRMFARSYRNILGEEGYKLLEAENIERIKNRVWEK